MDMKYVKPKSLAWWVSFLPLIGGIVIALSDQLPGLAAAAQVVHTMAGDMTAAQLIQLGLLGIGLRGAIQ